MDFEESSPVSFSLCPDPRADAAVKRYLSRVSAALRRACPKVRCIFLSGSASLGELTAVAPGGDRVAVYSDLDVGIVFGDRYSKLEARERLEAGVRVPVPAGLELLGGCEVGLYTPDELAGQPPKTGTLDLRRHAVVLWGERSLLELVPEYQPDEIDFRECLYLLLNRVLEFLEREESRSASPEAIPLDFAWAKMLLDVPTIVLASSGRYVSGAGRRVALFEELAGTDGSLRELYDEWPGLASALEKSLGYKLHGRRPVEGWFREAEAAERARAVVEMTWRWLLRRRGIETESGSAVRLASASLSLEPFRTRARGWKELLGRRKDPLLLLRCGRLLRKGSPAHLLLVSGGLFLVGRRAEGGIWRSFLERHFPLDPIRGTRSGAEEAWRKRLIEAWRELVTGGLIALG